jgi:hypothetical protein
MSSGALVLAVWLGAAGFGGGHAWGVQDQLPSGDDGWPCTAGRPVDPSYLAVSEGTGGQLFMLQPGEADHAGLLMTASRTHPVTIERGVGQLRGTREFSVPVDGTVDGLFVAASLQCHQAITIVRPDGVAVNAANAADDVVLKTGRLTRVETPLPGMWRVTMAGRGLFTFSVRASTPVAVSASIDASDGASQPGQGAPVHMTLDVELSQPVDGARVRLITAAGEVLAEHKLPEDGALEVARPSRPFRVAVEGVDREGAPVRRVHPVLFGLH